MTTIKNRPKIKAMHHTAISVMDIDRSLEFYRDLLGMKVTIDSQLSGRQVSEIVGLENVNARRVYVEGYGGRIEIFQYRSPTPKPFPKDFRVCDMGLTHFAFTVENVQELYEEFSAKGVTFNSAPLPIPNRGLACYLQDPDGITLEFLELFTPGT